MDRDVLAAVKDPNDEAVNDDLYTKLMGKETQVLKLMDALAEREAEAARPKPLFDMSLTALTQDFMRAWTGIVHDVMLLTSVPSFDRVIDIFLAPARQMHVGLAFVLVALVIFIADVL